MVFSPNNVYAIFDPLSLPNNKFGVHILFPTEISDAARLVNSSGGDWGYVTIPIQAGDKDIEKWQKFMDDARKFHLIPIIRLATENFYFDTKVWRKPTENDVMDFANFLDSLSWPVKNRYVVIFNEVNRGDEWGGSPNPAEYAEILTYAVDTFKAKNDDFFIISAGLDNASANIPNQSVNQYDFMLQMDREIPKIFEKIDGLGSHSYPNPGFSQLPWITTDKNINSFKFERNLVYNLSGKLTPVFITETGWSNKNIPDGKIAEYFSYAFEYIWSDNDVVAVTPFLLQAGAGPFLEFSLTSRDGNFNTISQVLQKIPKVQGTPILMPNIDNRIDIASFLFKKHISLPFKKFPRKTQYTVPAPEKTETVTAFFKWLLKL